MKPSTLERYLLVEDVQQTFKTKKGPFIALKDINLSVRQGEFITLIGHSGCGKSTLLNLIAGLTLPTEGRLICAGREIAGPGPNRAVVFQNHSLLPWLSCFENVYLGVERVFAATETNAQLKERTEEVMALVGLTASQHKMPHEVSGGMKQRVGIARALAMEPQVLLLDVPFGALDALTRANLQDELIKIMASKNSTAVMVTHDVDEAILLGTKVGVMTAGPGGTLREVITVNATPEWERSDPNYMACYDTVHKMIRDEVAKSVSQLEQTA